MKSFLKIIVIPVAMLSLFLTYGCLFNDSDQTDRCADECEAIYDIYSENCSDLYLGVDPYMYLECMDEVSDNYNGCMDTCYGPFYFY